MPVKPPALSELEIVIGTDCKDTDGLFIGSAPQFIVWVKHGFNGKLGENQLSKGLTGSGCARFRTHPNSALAVLASCVAEAGGREEEDEQSPRHSPCAPEMSCRR